MKTINDVLDAIDAMVKSEDLGDYGKTLQGARTRGSTTTAGLGSLPGDRVIVPLDHPAIQPGSVAYTVDAPELGGSVKAISVEEASERGLPVRLRLGDHGMELVLDEVLAEERKTNVVTIITEEHNGRWVVSTWHPGLPLVPLHKDTAVKTHNG
jgi:hypothetical protein